MEISIRGLLGLKKKQPKPTEFTPDEKAKIMGAVQQAQIAAMYSFGSPNYGMPLMFDGEQSYGGIGPVQRVYLDYYSLATRSWDLYLNSEIAQIVFNRLATWVIGRGLELESDPMIKALQMEGLKVDEDFGENFTQEIEALWRVWANSNMPSFNNMWNLGQISQKAYINSIVGGHVLVILRVKDGLPCAQLIDGVHLITPPTASSNGIDRINPDTGFVIRGGIEMDHTGQHVAYWIQESVVQLNYKRIPAFGKKSGQRMAYIVNSPLGYRLDNEKNLPLISAVMETAKKMERYKDATLGKAEEIAKVVYQILHDNTSDGSNPLIENIAKSINIPTNSNPNQPTDITGKELADRIAITTGKSVYDMGVGKKLESVDNQDALYFKDFYTVNMDIVCAAVGIPPNVATMLYDGNFSASRAALKDWEHTLHVRRWEFYKAFLTPIYNLFLDISVLSGKVKAPDYLEAMLNKNRMVLEAYRHATFIGPNVPHIQPTEEVAAERAKLGPLFANVPLTTAEAATRALNAGSARANIKQSARELEEAQDAGLMLQEQPQDGGDGNNNGGDGEAPPKPGEDKIRNGKEYVKGHWRVVKNKPKGKSD